MTFSSVLPRRAAARRDPARNAVRRLAVSRFISMAGTDATGVAVGYAMYAQTHSAAWLSLSLLLTIAAGAALAPFGGKLGDLVDRRKLMIGAELAAAAVFVTLALIHTPAALLALGLVATAIGTVFGPASGAAIAHVAGDRHLSWANGVVSTASNAGKTAGRLAAGAAIAILGAGSVFLLDAVTFIASAWLIASVRRGFSAPLTGPAAGDEPVADAARAAQSENGLRILFRHPKLRLVIASACVSTFATAFSMTAEVPLVFEMGAGALGLGALTACWTAGMIFGSWYGGRALHRDNEATGMLVGRLAMAGGIGLIALSPSLTPMLACYLLGGLGGGFMGVASQSLILRSVPDQVRARTLGAIDACRNVTFGLGVLGAGTLVGLLGARPVYALVGMVMAIGAAPLAALVMRLGGPRPLRPGAAVPA
jgi:MFS family permease